MSLSLRANSSSFFFICSSAFAIFADSFLYSSCAERMSLFNFSRVFFPPSSCDSSSLSLSDNCFVRCFSSRLKSLLKPSSVLLAPLISLQFFSSSSLAFLFSLELVEYRLTSSVGEGQRDIEFVRRVF